MTAKFLVVGRNSFLTSRFRALNEIVVALRRQDLHAGGRKIASFYKTLESVAAWRAKGLKIGFTNGCCDLLHPGHVSLLAQARAACDRLIVGLNDDASVQRL